MKYKPAALLPLLLIAVLARGQNLDVRWLDRLNSPLHPPADRPWQLVSQSMAPVGIAVPAGLFIAGAARHDHALRCKAYAAGGAFLLSAGITTLTKISVRRPRPFIAHPELFTKKDKGGGYSFPSGHTAVAFATATSLSLACPKWYVIAPSFAYAGAVAYSRMYLGVHYPSDILGGIVVGVGTSLLAFQIERWLR